MTEDNAARPEQEPAATETVSLDKGSANESGAEEGRTAAEPAPTEVVDVASGATVEITAPTKEAGPAETPETVTVPETVTKTPATEDGATGAASAGQASPEEAAAPAPPSEAGPSEAGPSEPEPTLVVPPAVTAETALPAAEPTLVEAPPGATVEIKAPTAGAPEVPATVITPVPPAAGPNAWPSPVPNAGAPDVAAQQVYPPYPPQAWPPPAAQPGPWHPPAPPPPPRRSFPKWILIAFAAVVGVAIVGGIVALVVVSVAPKPVDMAGEAVTSASQWGGATYRGTVDGVRGDTTFDVSVTGQGLRGTLTRPGGAKAEVVKDSQGTLIRGNKQWWQTRYSADADKLADVWLGDAAAELSDVDTILKTEPRGLAKVTNIDPKISSLWRESGERDIDGVRVLELTDGFHRVWVTADSPHRLVAMDIVYSRKDGEPTRIIELDAALIEQVNRAAAAARGTTPPKSISQRRADRPRYQFKADPPPLCDTPMCSATFTLTNTGELAGTGQVVVTADGLPVATHDFSLEPGKSVTYQEQTPNTHFNDPAGTRFTINWSARVVEPK